MLRLVDVTAGSPSFIDRETRQRVATFLYYLSITSTNFLV
jgi:hypothetical protein